MLDSKSKFLFNEKGLKFSFPENQDIFSTVKIKVIDSPRELI